MPQAKAQYETTLSTDSTRVVALREVIVSTVQKTAQQRLVIFFRANQNATIEEIMSRLPEINMIRRGAYGMEPSVRSFNGGQINVLLDGMRMHGACTDKMDPATIYIEPMNLENLQVQTSSTGFLNGSVIGGTINMKMAEPAFLSDKKISGFISSGFQSAAKSFYESARFNFSSGHWALLATGTYRHYNNYRSGGGSIIPFSQFEKVNYSLSVKYGYNAHTFLKADFLGDDGWNIGYPALPMDVGYAAARIAALTVLHENREKNVYRWQVKIYSNSVRHFMDDTQRPDIILHMDMPGQSNTSGFYADGEIKLSRSQKLLLKTDAATTFLKASMTMYPNGQLPMYMLTWPDNRKYQAGIAASWIWQADSMLRFQANSRVDFMDHYLATSEAKNQWSIFGYEQTQRKQWLKNISVSATVKPARKLTSTVALSYSERMATASELFGVYLFNSEDGYDYIGNPSLKNETNFQTEFTVSYAWRKDRIQFSIFHSNIHHYIMGTIQPGMSPMTIGANGVKKYINIPRVVLYGAEATVVLKPSRLFEVVTALRYTSGKDNNRNPLPFVAPLKNTASLRYQPGKFYAQLEYEAALKQNRFSPAAGEDFTPAYFLVHARMAWATSLFKTDCEWQAGMENIFDVTYHEHTDWGNVPRPGRNVYLQFRVRF